MDFIGFDLGKVSSQVCIITEDGDRRSFTRGASGDTRRQGGHSRIRV